VCWEFCETKFPKAVGFLRSSTATLIDGVVKMPLRASIFTPGRINVLEILFHKILKSRWLFALIDGVVKMPLRASIFTPGGIT